MFGMYLACVWNVFGICLECIWHVFGMYLACVSNVFGNVFGLCSTINIPRVIHVYYSMFFMCLECFKHVHVLSYASSPTPFVQPPPLIHCFCVNLSPLFAILFYTLSFPSACRITVLLEKDIQRKPANKNPPGISAYRQRILNKSHEKTNYFVVLEL